MLWGKDGQARLTAAHVIVFGLGGVGSYVTECLARAGVGELTLVDSDTVALSNLNRQLEALNSTVGLPKAEAVVRRVRDINPYAVLHPMEALYNADKMCIRDRCRTVRRRPPPTWCGSADSRSRRPPPRRGPTRRSGSEYRA